MSNDGCVIEFGVRLNGKSAIAVRTPFHPTFVDAFKQLVPKSEREFKERSGSWLVIAKRAEGVEQLVLNFFGQYMIKGGRRDGEIHTRGGAVAKQESLAL